MGRISTTLCLVRSNSPGGKTVWRSGYYSVQLRWSECDTGVKSAIYNCLVIVTCGESTEDFGGMESELMNPLSVEKLDFLTIPLHFGTTNVLFPL